MGRGDSKHKSVHSKSFHAARECMNDCPFEYASQRERGRESVFFEIYEWTYSPRLSPPERLNYTIESFYF